MPSPARLKRRSEYLAVARRGRKWSGRGIFMQALRRDHNDVAPARVGYTASRKVGGAVIRNRAKRRLRALAEEWLRNAAHGFDVVLIAKSATVEMDFDQLRQEMRQGLAQLKLLETG